MMQQLVLALEYPRAREGTRPRSTPTGLSFVLHGFVAAMRVPTAVQGIPEFHHFCVQFEFADVAAHNRATMRFAGLCQNAPHNLIG